MENSDEIINNIIDLSEDDRIKIMLKIVESIPLDRNYTELNEPVNLKKKVMKDLNKLSKEIYEANKAKGFHEVKHSIEHLFCLVISELMEAVEADRKGRRADWEEVLNLWSIRYMNYDSYCRDFEEHIKDTLEDELADAVIRLLDTAGALELELLPVIETKDNFYYYGTKDFYKNHLFTENIYEIISRSFLSKKSKKISNMIFDIDILCEVMNINLWQHIELKLKYNSLRPYKHGKAY